MRTIHRGDFIKLTSMLGAGLALGVRIEPAEAVTPFDKLDPKAAFSPNAFVHVHTDGTVTVMVQRAEMGQGVVTGIPTIVAEELDVPMTMVRPAFPDADPTEFGDMSTGGSRSMNVSWDPLRKAGATARAMLVAAAAQKWGVDPSTCTTSDGVVTSGAHRATYGELAALAAKQPVPQTVRLKDPGEFKVVGTSPARFDVPLKVRGAAEYGIDVRLPGMLYARVLRPPTFGGSLVALDDSAARKLPGVVEVVKTSFGPAVVATNTWAAFRGADALKPTWKDGATPSSSALFAEAEQLVREPGIVGEMKGSGPMPSGAKTYEATYRGHYLAHAPMEPLNATAHVHGDGAEIWLSSQAPQSIQVAAAKYLGVPVDKVRVHRTYLGGGFGRRSWTDFGMQAVEVAKAVGKPVKVTWTREDDIKNDYFRPMSVNLIKASVDKQGKIVAWDHRVACSSVFKLARPERPHREKQTTEGTAPECYDLGWTRNSWTEQDPGVPVGFLRAPYCNWNTFPTETMIDEIAHDHGHDPVAYRLAMMTDPRAKAALEMVRDKVWRKPLPGATQGVAIGFYGSSIGATIADVIFDGKTIEVPRVAMAVHVGQPINPDIIVMQTQSAINYGIALAMTSKITLTKGRIDQNNFYDYTVLRMKDAPRRIDVHIVPSHAHPTGIGELGTPGIAPAIANAIFAKTGKRFRTLPFSDALA